jgi:hypothetical protein
MNVVGVSTLAAWSAELLQVLLELFSMHADAT